MSSAQYLLPAPVVFPGDEPFWQAASQGRLLIKHCPNCNRSHFYPRQHCPLCGHHETHWREASGRAKIYSFSIMGRAARPTAPAIVELEEGVRLSTVVVDADLHALRIDDPVTLRFLPTEQGMQALAFTTPAAEQARRYTQAALQALGSAPNDGVPAFKEAAVIGAGNMGTGIALALLGAGLRVLLVDTAEASLAAGRQRIEQALGKDLERGRLDAATHAARRALLHTSTALQDVACADVVIEAVFEDLALKQQLFAALDAVAAPHALLATNTSTLDVGAIAAATRRPGSVLGLHFFNPANVMRLIEVVRAPQTSPQALQQARGLARQLRKVAVVVGICDGFVGNRLMIRREREAARLLLEGALPAQIDRVQREFGLPMGTFERGRTGQRAGKGYYRYEPGKRAPIVDPEVTALIEQASREAGIARRTIGDEEIRDRLILPMVNEGAKLVEEGIVERASDIDLVWQFGYGWPDWKGGPMHHADTLGLATVVKRLQSLQAAHGESFEPAALLVRLAQSGQSLTQTTS